ncbi:nuclear transport factor 2 family protein [Streptomyces sp. NPDC002896]|uniref:nuclear transport factor 2 family protein n=1 Tax=Streptomyces sp. NPDC002896 TaxID=3154438 RepID=UPI00332EE7D9
MSSSAPYNSAARPGASPSDAEAVWAVITGMYEAYAAGDRVAIDARLDPEATIWDSAADGLLLGKGDLDRLRDARPAAGGGPVETGLDAYEPVVDVFGDMALLRYWLRVDFAAAPDGGVLRPELVRNSVVLRRGADGDWRIVHLHEDVRQPGGVPEPGA